MRFAVLLHGPVSCLVITFSFIASHRDQFFFFFSTLADTLANMDLSALKPLPPPKTFKFSENLASHFGVN